MLLPQYRRGGLIDWIGVWLVRLGLLGVVLLAVLTGYGPVPDDTGWWAAPIFSIVLGFCMIWRTGYPDERR